MGKVISFFPQTFQELANLKNAELAERASMADHEVVPRHPLSEETPRVGRTVLVVVGILAIVGCAVLLARS